MCDPITLGLVLTGGSVISNKIGSNMAARARKRALLDEQLRQDKLRREQDALNLASQQQYQDFEGQQAEEASTLTDYFQNAPQSAAEAVGAANVGAASVLPSSSNDIVTQEIKRQGALADAFTGQQGAARADLRSFGDLLAGLSLDQARNATLSGQLGGFRQGSMDVLPYELDAANRRGSGWRTFGDILGGLGSVALTGGITSAAQAGNIPGWLGGGGGLTSLFSKSAPALSAVRPRARPENITGYL